MLRSFTSCFIFCEDAIAAFLCEAPACFFSSLMALAQLARILLKVPPNDFNDPSIFSMDLVKLWNCFSVHASLTGSSAGVFGGVDRDTRGQKGGRRGRGNRMGNERARGKVDEWARRYSPVVPESPSLGCASAAII